jgi:hypothetical protein
LFKKRHFYVSVGSGEILEDHTALNYDFEIIASDEEIDKLQQLFEDTNEAEEKTFKAGHAMNVFDPTVNYSSEAANSLYDNELQAIYRMLYELGTERTKRHIKSMNVL